MQWSAAICEFCFCLVVLFIGFSEMVIGSDMSCLLCVFLTRLVAESFNVAPLIDDTEHSTRPPAEVEDERFGPSSMGLPTPMGDTEGVGMAYFIQRIR